MGKLLIQLYIILSILRSWVASSNVGIGQLHSPLPSRNVSVGVVTWNLAERSPNNLNFLTRFNSTDIIVFGVQECEDIRPRRTEGRRSKLLRKKLKKTIGKSYKCVKQSKLGGIIAAIYVKKAILHSISDIQGIEVACGIGNVLANKGATCIVMKIYNQTIAFINAHLAAHQHKVKARNDDYNRIMNTLILQCHDHHLTLYGRSMKRLLQKGQNNYEQFLPLDITNTYKSISKMIQEPKHQLFGQVWSSVEKSSTSISHTAMTYFDSWNKHLNPTTTNTNNNGSPSSKSKSKYSSSSSSSNSHDKSKRSSKKKSEKSNKKNGKNYKGESTTTTIKTTNIDKKNNKKVNVPTSSPTVKSNEKKSKKIQSDKKNGEKSKNSKSKQGENMEKNSPKQTGTKKLPSSALMNVAKTKSKNNKNKNKKKKKDTVSVEIVDDSVDLDNMNMKVYKPKIKLEEKIDMITSIPDPLHHQDNDDDDNDDSHDIEGNVDVDVDDDDSDNKNSNRIVGSSRPYSTSSSSSFSISSSSSSSSFSTSISNLLVEEEDNDDNDLAVKHSPFDSIIFFGDLNYRLNAPRLEVELLKSNLERVNKDSPRYRKLIDSDMQKILDRDQLIHEISCRHAFHGFREGKITFLPTFKYDRGKSDFDSSSKNRPPAWTDRILFKISKHRKIYNQGFMKEDNQKIKSQKLKEEEEDDDDDKKDLKSKKSKKSKKEKKSSKKKNKKNSSLESSKNTNKSVDSLTSSYCDTAVDDSSIVASNTPHLELIEYSSIQHYMDSDHRPVYGKFLLHL